MKYKHFLLVLGLHSLTGSTKIIDIFHKLEKWIPYNLICGMKIAQANCFLISSFRNNSLIDKLRARLYETQSELKPV